MFDLENYRFSRLISDAGSLYRGLCKTISYYTHSWPHHSNNWPPEGKDQWHWPMGLQMVPRGRTHQILWTLGFLSQIWVYQSFPRCSHCRWHHYRNSLALPPISIAEALISHRERRITLFRGRSSALLCWDIVSGVFNPFTPGPSCGSALGWRLWFQ